MMNLFLQQSYCKYTTNGFGALISGFLQVKSGSESDLQSAVANVGPIAVAVDANSAAFRVSKWSCLYILPWFLLFDIHVILVQYYSGGVYSSIKCSRTSLNHAMLVTGFGTYNGKDYYLVKNRYPHMI